MPRLPCSVRLVLVFLAIAASCGFSQAQVIASAELPDAPQPQQAAPAPPNPAQPPADSGTQTKRILGIFPNFRAVSASTHLPPQSVKEKFITASQDSFDYSAFFVPAVVAGYGLADNKVPEFHHGAVGYGRYYWHSLLDQTSENYMVEFIVPTLTHEDTRYYTLGSAGGSSMKRIGYSLSRVLVTRSDAGHRTFNFSEVFGAGAAAGISNTYYPRSQRTFSNTAEEWGTNVGIDAASFVVREFWPDVNRALFHGKQGPTQTSTTP